MQLVEMGFSLDEVQSAAHAGCTGFDATLSWLLCQQQQQQQQLPPHTNAGAAALKAAAMPRSELMGLLEECSGVDLDDPEVQQLITSSSFDDSQADQQARAALSRSTEQAIGMMTNSAFLPSQNHLRVFGVASEST